MNQSENTLFSAWLGSENVHGRREGREVGRVNSMEGGQIGRKLMGSDFRRFCLALNETYVLLAVLMT